MSEPINWNAKRQVFVNRTFSVAFVKVRADQYMELDDYREDGGNTLRELPPYTEFVGTFTNAEIQKMDYPK